ncbi:50S ribosomal protein L17 [Aquiflexum sp.]|uniref:50S ribosomal protein L17 n=1 Tax=Aquiflexum sp. TaxID=1872584 RepID=UPI00359381C0
MRHGKKFNHLGRTASHRKAMLSNMATSLILHKRISTTLAKAKELRKYVEPLITRAKEDITHNRRIAFSYLQSKEGIKELFGEVVVKVGDRTGGYTRIIKTGYRLGDNAEMCIIELVDFNELMLKDAKPAKKTTRRSRRSSGKSETAVAETAPVAKTEEVAEPQAEEPQADENNEEEKSAE